nr:phage major capsid protein [uncultured Roseateles sp.]
MTIKVRPQSLAPQVRTMTARLAPANGEAQRGLVDTTARTMQLAFASETPVDMWYGTEILSMAPGAMRTGVRQLTMPLLYNHNLDDLLGRVEGIAIHPDRIARADVRFGKDERGEWAMQQADDEILVNVSFKYRVYKWIEDTENDLLIAIDWEAYEISLMTVPGDPTVGAGRGAQLDTENGVQIEVRSAAAPAPSPSAPGVTSAPEAHSNPSNSQEQSTMNVRFRGQFRNKAGGEEDGSGGGGGTTITAPPADPTALAQRGAMDERARVNEIEAICKKYDLSAELRTAMVQRGATVDQARLTAADMVMERARNKPAADFGDSHNPDLTAKEKARFSMIRAVNASLSGNWKEAGFELECSNDIAKKLGRGAANERGFFVPTNIQFAMRAPYAVGTPGAGTTGGTLVGTQLLPGSFIEVLRNKARTMQAGATVISGLVGAVTIPRQTGQTATFWTAEGVDTSEGEATFDSITLNMKTIGTFSQISRNMLMQGTPDIDMLARADMLAAIALGIDLAVLSAPGTGSQPLGISNQAGVGSVIGGVNGAQLTIDHLIDLETQVMDANAPEDSLAYIMNPRSVGWAKKLKSTTGQYLWTTYPGGQRSGTPGEVNGYPVLRSKQARNNLVKGSSGAVCSELFYGAWSEALIAEWGVLEILPSTTHPSVYKNGGVLLRALQSLDIGVRHTASFSVMSDALTV